MKNTNSLQKLQKGLDKNEPSLQSIDDGEEDAYWKLKEKKKRTKKEQENLVRLERKMHDETQADRQYAPVLSQWCTKLNEVRTFLGVLAPRSLCP